MSSIIITMQALVEKIPSLASTVNDKNMIGKVQSFNSSFLESPLKSLFSFFYSTKSLLITLATYYNWVMNLRSIKKVASISFWHVACLNSMTDN